eukprot:527997_1
MSPTTDSSYDLIDTYNKQALSSIENEFRNLDTNTNLINSSYLLNINHETELSNEFDISKYNYDKKIVNTLVQAGIASREICIKASSIAENCHDINEVMNQTIMIITEHCIMIAPEDSSNCDLSKCFSLKKILKTLSAYDEFSHQSTSQDNVPEKKLNLDDVLDGKDIISFINDFHHMLTSHENEFEDVFEQFAIHRTETAKCTVPNCLMFQRNYRNRKISSNAFEAKTMYFNREVVEDVVNQQLFDKVHCHYLHSFQIGYKLCRDDKKKVASNIDNCDLKENESIDRHSNDQIVRSMHQLIKNKKCNEYNVAPSKFVITDERWLKYSVGMKYFYWDYYKNNQERVDPATKVPFDDNYIEANQGFVLQEFYVESKYKNLKEELVTNAICTISANKLNQIITKAKYHQQTKFFSSIVCKYLVMDFKKYYNNLMEGTPMTIPHIMAMMVYCNEDLLQRKFSETFRRMKSDETNESIINRHRNFVHLGRLLRECVFCFGSKNANDFVEVKLYHGTSIQAQFSSTDALVNGPFSTTTDASVALNFSQKTGMVLELSLNGNWYEDRSVGGLFECQKLSDFPNEAEVFFIGGYGGFIILSIIDVASGSNYQYYVYALGRISSALNDINIKFKALDDHKNEKYNALVVEHLVYRMILHELNRCFPKNKDFAEFKKMPLYVAQLLRYHFANINSA